jgi:hypothetical protein
MVLPGSCLCLGAATRFAIPGLPWRANVLGRQAAIGFGLRRVVVDCCRCLIPHQLSRTEVM